MNAPFVGTMLETEETGFCSGAPVVGLEECLPRMKNCWKTFSGGTRRETMKLEFFMPMVPPTVTHQEKQVRVVKGKPVFYEPPELREARAKLEAHLAGHRPERSLGGGVRLVVKWCFPRGRHGDGEYRVTRPDTDNLQKLLKDCMTRVGFWGDDAQVASEVCEKFWAEVPGIYVCAEEIG